MVLPDTLNDEIHVVELFNFVVPDTFRLFTFNVVALDNEFKLLKIVVDVAFRLFIDNVELVDS
jgi:hypothetical protein